MSTKAPSELKFPDPAFRASRGLVHYGLARGGFTLIELLVVIAIIGILAGILIPTVGSVRVSAKRAETKVRFSQWALAMEQFKQEYGYYPLVTASGGHTIDPTNFLAALTGRDYTGTLVTGTALNGNKKSVPFYSITESELVKDSGGAIQNRISDSFGNSEIVVLVDIDGDGVIKGSELPSPPAVHAGDPPQGTPLAADVDNFPATGIRAGVIFYSAGRGATQADIIYSWK